MQALVSWRPGFQALGYHMQGRKLHQQAASFRNDDKTPTYKSRARSTNEYLTPRLQSVSKLVKFDPRLGKRHWHRVAS